MIVTAVRAKRRDVITIWFASSRLPSPRLRATRAEMDTLTAMKIAKATNFGWAVSPTEATADGPSELTIRESKSPAKAMKKDSKIDGHAILKQVLKCSFLGKFDINCIVVLLSFIIIICLDSSIFYPIFIFVNV